MGRDNLEMMGNFVSFNKDCWKSWKREDYDDWV